MRKQENLYSELVLCPDEVQSFFHRISDVMAAVAERVCPYDITALYVQDDVAFNGGLLISPEHLREFILPHWKKVIDVAHAAGIPVFFHTDGKTDNLWELFREELGICMLNPFQPELHDFKKFKQDNHGRMGAYGGLATNRLHEMTPTQIETHVFLVFEELGYGGGLIISSHDIDYAITLDQLDAHSEAVHTGCYG